MKDSIFTKIIKGEISCYKVYEDDLTLAFLDIHPSHHGHTLVVSKKQVDQYIDLPAEDYAALWQTVHKVAKKLREVIGKDRVGIIVKGVEVSHAHVHLIPFNNDERLKADEDSSGNEAGSQELAELAEKLKI